MSSPRCPLALLAVLMLGVLAGCATPTAQPARSSPMNTPQPTIELLGFPDCPNTPTLRANLTAALSSMNKGWTFADTNQEKLPEGDLRRGWPTPTVLVNGRDLFGMAPPTAPSMGCRMYPGGVPDAQTIAGTLKATKTP